MAERTRYVCVCERTLKSAENPGLAIPRSWYRAQKPLKPGNTKKIRKNTKSPGSGPENMKKTQKKQRKWSFLGHFRFLFFCVFLLDFFGARPRVGELVIFSYFFRISGFEGILEEGRLGVPGEVWEFRFLPSFPTFPKENRSSRNVWENAWSSQTSFFQTSAAF